MKACIGEFFDDTQETCHTCEDKANCKLFSAYLQRTKKSPSEFFDVEYNGVEYFIVHKGNFNRDRFLQICREQVRYENNERRRKNIAKAMVGVDRFGDNGRQKSAESTRAYWRRRIDELVDDYKHFRQHLLKKVNTTFASKNTAPVRGQFVDHFRWRRVERPISVYYKNNLYKEVLVCTLYVKVQRGVIDVEVNAPLGLFEKFLTLEDKHKLQPMVVNIPEQENNYTFCSGLDREKLAIVAEVIAKLVQKNFFDTKHRA